LFSSTTTLPQKPYLPSFFGEGIDHVKHIGLAGILANEGKLNYSKVVEHFMAVNDCSLSDFDQYVSEAFAQWEERSQHEWTTDFSKYKNVFTPPTKDDKSKE